MLSERLKSLRKEKDLTQRELANILNISNGTIAMYETNKRQPDNETLTILADFFNVSTDYLLARTNIRNNDSSSINEQFEELLNDPSLIVTLKDIQSLPARDKQDILDYIDYVKFKKNKDKL